MKELRLHGEAIITGMGSIQYLNQMCFEKVFIVTGQGSVFKNGTIQKITNILDNKNCLYRLHSGIKKNPDTKAVLDGVAEMQEFNPDAIIAVGGGSAIDAAKVMSIFYDYPELNFEILAAGNIPDKRKSLKLIAIPTTSGTGTEVTRSAVITYRDTNIKIGLKSPAFIPDIAILDGELTLTMPQNVAAETGMDAMTHAVECYINKNLDDYTECLAIGAIKGLFEYLPSSCLKGDAFSREKVHNYQSIAGSAFANVGLGMAHGISHSIGGLLDYGHGLLNAVALPYVLQFNSKDEEVGSRLRKAAKAIEVEDFISAIKELNAQLGIPSSFQEMGIDDTVFQSHFEQLLDNAMKGSTRVNPIPISRDEMKKLLNYMHKGINIGL
jgi:alcohol dehydrogenase class IV